MVLHEGEKVNLRERILNGDSTIGIVGLGYIGFSTAAHYANAGAKVVGVDLDQTKVDSFFSTLFLTLFCIFLLLF